MSILQVDNLSGLSGTDITIEIGKAIKGAASQFKITGGTAGQIIQTDGSGGLSFITSGGLPTQTGNTGKYLTTDGSAASWGTITIPSSLPSQSAHAGKYLTTDGTNESWGTVSGAEISELNNFFKNWNVIDTTITTTVASTENAAIIGPLGINTTGKWNIDGKVTIM